MTEAMTERQDFFPPLCRALTAAGEESGCLAELVEELVAYYTRQEKIKAFMLQAAFYPTLVLIIAFIMLLLFIGYVLPVLANAYTTMGAKLTGVAGFLLRLQMPYMTLLFCSIPCIIFAISRCHILPPKEKWLFLGAYFRSIQEIRICRLLSLLLQSGLGLSEAINLIVPVVSDFCQAELLILQTRLTRGVDLTIALQACTGVFSPLTRQLLIMGISTGRLADMLQEAAQLEEASLESSLKKVQQLLGPSLLIIAAVITGFIICSVLEPLFNLMGTVPIQH